MSRVSYRVAVVPMLGVALCALAALVFLLAVGGPAGATEPDKTPPVVTVSGTAIQAVEESKTTGSYELHIVAADGSKTAPQSGVAKVEVAVDGSGQQYWEKTCPEGSCGLEETWTYSPGNFPLPGAGHVIIVKVTDHAGNVTEERISREGVEPVLGEAAPTGPDTIPPEVGFFGSAVKAIEEGATSGNYELHIAAVDGSPTAPQSGVAKIEVGVDGTTLQYWEKACPVGSCHLEVSWPYAPGNFPGEGHVITITVRDHAGNVTTRTIEPTEFPQAIAAWSFEEGSGTVTHVVTGSGHDGTLSTKGVSWAPGKYGTALKFDGKEGCVTVPDSPALQLHEEFTLEAWVKPEGELLHLPAITKQAEGFPAYGLGVGMTSAGRAEGQIGTATKSHTDVTSPASLEANVWTQEAVTFDGTYLRLYVNGTLVATKAVALPAAGVAGPLEIGCSSSGHFRGSIDEVRIYRRSLSSAQLLQTVNAGLPVVITAPASEVDSNDAVMSGTARGYGEGTEYFFEYGPTTAYGSVATGEEVEGNGETTEVEEVAINLVPEMTYHYRLAAEGPAGTAYGQDQTFTTAIRTRTVQEEEQERAEEEAPFEGESGNSFSQPQSGPTSAPAIATPSNFFGMDWDGNIAQMVEAKDFTAIQDSGAQVFRFVVAENNEGAQEKAFAEAKNHGLTPLPYLGQGAFPKVGVKQTAFIKFAKEMIRKYGPSGTSYQAGTWEIWNEPNMPHRLNEAGKPPVFENSEYQGKAEPKEFAEFYKKLVKEIKSVAPGIKILSPGLFGYKNNTKGAEGHYRPRAFMKIFDATLEESPKLEDPYDGISLHPYVFKTRNPKKKHEKAHKPRDATDARQVRGEIKGLIWGVHAQSVKDFEKAGEKEPNKPIWVTELGFPVRSEIEGNEDKSIPPVSLSEQSLLLQATFSMLAHHPGNLQIQHAIYYNIQDLPTESWENHSGLLEESINKEGKSLPGNPRPAWEAFRKLAGGKACTVAPC